MDNSTMISVVLVMVSMCVHPASADGSGDQLISSSCSEHNAGGHYLKIRSDVAVNNVNVSWIDHPLIMSSIGPDNPLPAFFFSRVQGEGAAAGAWTKWDGTAGTPEPFTPPDTSDPEIWKNTAHDLRIPLLPWAEQDSWGCEQKPGSVRMVKIENEFLEVLVAPQYGGKVWRVYDKILKRDLFLNNRANQPVNFAMRKAWTSGGIEFNWSPGYIGHSTFTLSPVYAAVLPTSKGPIVRVYEYDRIKNTTWQVDIIIDERVLFVHPKVHNSNNVDVRGYWWTNVGLKTDIKGVERVLMPAKWTYEHVKWPNDNYVIRPYNFSGLGLPFSSNVHGPWEIDSSWLGNLPDGNDFFMQLCDEEDKSADLPPHCRVVQHRPKPFAYIALADADGNTTIHGHRGLGTKFFTYGNVKQSVGQFLQDFMSASNISKGEHRGNYLEQQTGREPTQMHNFNMPANGGQSWTEWFAATKFSAEAVHSKNYSDALLHLDQWIESEAGVSQARYSAMEEFFESVESMPVAEGQVIARGMPWGGLQQRLTGRYLSASQYYDEDTSMNFQPSLTLQAAPWRDLLTFGTFTSVTLSRNPVSFVTSIAWMKALQESIVDHGDTWLHQLHLGVIFTEAFDAASARIHFNKSYSMKKSATAARNLALLADNVDEAWQWYMQGWDAIVSWDESDPNQNLVMSALAAEIANFGVANHNFQDKLKVWLNSQDKSAKWQQSDPVLLAKVVLALPNDPHYAADLIARECWPTFVQSHGMQLAELWFEAQYAIAKVACSGCELTPFDMHNIRLAKPVPGNIGGYQCQIVNTCSR